MEKKFQKQINKFDDYIYSFDKNLSSGHWNATIGIPISWEIRENNMIGYEVLGESDVGKKIKIVPKKENVVFDDIVLFITVLVETNKEIAKKESEFKEEIEKAKNDVKKRIEEFYKKLEEDKKDVFNNLLNNFKKEFDEEDDNKENVGDITKDSEKKTENGRKRKGENQSEEK